MVSALTVSPVFSTPTTVSERKWLHPRSFCGYPLFWDPHR